MGACLTGWACFVFVLSCWAHVSPCTARQGTAQRHSHGRTEREGGTANRISIATAHKRTTVCQQTAASVKSPFPFEFIVASAGAARRYTTGAGSAAGTLRSGAEDQGPCTIRDTARPPASPAAGAQERSQQSYR